MESKWRHLGQSKSDISRLFLDETKTVPLPHSLVALYESPERQEELFWTGVPFER